MTDPVYSQTREIPMRPIPAPAARHMDPSDRSLSAIYGAGAGWLVTLVFARFLQDNARLSPWLSLPVGTILGAAYFYRRSEQTNSLPDRTHIIELGDAPIGLDHIRLTPEACRARALHAGQMLHKPGRVNALGRFWQSGSAVDAPLLVRNGQLMRVTGYSDKEGLQLHTLEGRSFGLTAEQVDPARCVVTFPPFTALYLNRKGELVDMNHPTQTHHLDCSQHMVFANTAARTVGYEWEGHRLLAWALLRHEDSSLQVGTARLSQLDNEQTHEITVNPFDTLEQTVPVQIGDAQALVFVMRAGGHNKLRLHLWKPDDDAVRSLDIDGYKVLPCGSWMGCDCLFICDGPNQPLSGQDLWDRSAQADPAPILRSPSFGTRQVCSVAPLTLPNGQHLLAVGRRDLGVTLYNANTGQMLYSITHAPDENDPWLTRQLLPGKRIHPSELLWTTDQRGYPRLIIYSLNRWVWEHTWSEALPQLQPSPTYNFDD